MESLEHMIWTCQATHTHTRSRMQIGELLNEDGRGLVEMRRIEEERRKRKKDKKGF